MALFWAAIKRDSVSLFGFPFCSHVQVFSREISQVCRLKYPYSCFSSHFCFQVFTVVLFISAVTGRYNQFFFALVNVVLVSMHLHNLQSFLRLSLTLITCLYYLSGVRPCASPLIFLSYGSFLRVPRLSILRMVLSNLQGGLFRGLSLWWGSCVRALFWKVFLFVWGILFLFFLSPPLVCRCIFFLFILVFLTNFN